MPEIRPQYHFRRTAEGIDIFSVSRLIRLSEALPVRKVNPRTIAELHENHWYAINSGGSGRDTSIPTPASLLEHMQLIQACELRYPIILDAQGRLMDGMHRVCRAILDGIDEIPAVQFASDPPADFTNCSADNLPDLPYI